MSSIKPTNARGIGISNGSKTRKEDPDNKKEMQLIKAIKTNTTPPPRGVLTLWELRLLGTSNRLRVKKGTRYINISQVRQKAKKKTDVKNTFNY